MSLAVYALARLHHNVLTNGAQQLVYETLHVIVILNSRLVYMVLLLVERAARFRVWVLVQVVFVLKVVIKRVFILSVEAVSVQIFKAVSFSMVHIVV